MISETYNMDCMESWKIYVMYHLMPERIIMIGYLKDVFIQYQTADTQHPKRRLIFSNDLKLKNIYVGTQKPRS